MNHKINLNKVYNANGGKKSKEYKKNKELNKFT